jgi:hypothetical protein
MGFKMFCLLEDNYIIYGPYNWNQRLFQMVLQDDHNINMELPYYNSEVFVINDVLKIVPVDEVNIPEYNAIIHEVAGYTLMVKDNSVSMTYNIVDKSISTVKEQLKTRVAETRYNKEISGTYLNINGVDIKLYTDRASRNLYTQALQLGEFNKTWKFGDVWLVLNQEQLVHVVTAIANHVQSAYDWEKSIVDAIDAANDLSILSTINVKEGV